MSAADKSFFRYLPLSDRLEGWGLYLTGAGCSRVPPQSDYPRQGHPEIYQFTWDQGRTLPEYQLIYVTRGEGEFESERSDRHAISAGDVVLLFPDVWHRYRPTARRGWDAYWIGLNGDFLRRLQQREYIAPERPILHPGVDEAFLHPFLTILDRVRAPRIDNPLLLAAGAMEILGRLLASHVEPGEAAPRTPADARMAEDRIVAQAIRFIWNHSHRPMTVEDVVGSVPLARRTLERRFQEVLGRTIHDEITFCRVERVKSFLAETSLPMKRIASATGFPSTQQMTKVFHRLEGSTPAVYRRRHQARKSDDGGGESRLNRRRGSR